MEWQQLEHFRAVARLEHVSRAAREIRISQPALSRSIRRLESELGAPLFERERRSVRLNRYGRLFLGHVERALEEIEQGKKELSEVVGPERGEVTLAFLHTLGARLVPELLGTFRKQHPLVSFRLFQGGTDTILGHLKSGDADLILAAPQDRDGVTWQPLFSEELFLAVPPDHRLARRCSIHLGEVADDSFVCLKPTYGLRQITDELCEQAGFRPKVAFEGEEVNTARGLVAAGLGVALLPDAASKEREEPSYLYVQEPLCQRTVGLGWIGGRYLSPTTLLFRRLVMDHLVQGL